MSGLTVSRLALFEWLAPHCKDDAASLLNERGDDWIGWIYGREDFARAVAAWKDGRLEQELFKCKNKDGKSYTSRKPFRLGLVAHRDDNVLRFCIDLDDHEGGVCNVDQIDQMDQFLGAKAIRFTSKAAAGFT
jgi:hypothetical protein